MKCALDCVHSCLAKCQHAQAAGDTACYAACTKPCLPRCVATSSALSVEALTAVAEAHAGKTTVEGASVAAAVPPNTAAPVETLS